MAPTSYEIRCPQCMAPAAWDGQARTVTCAYCKTNFIPGAMAPQVAPPRPTGGSDGLVGAEPNRAPLHQGQDRIV